VDTAFVVRGATALLHEGGRELRVRETAKSPWRALIAVGLEENVALLDFTEDGRSVTLTSSIDSDTERVVEKSLKTGSERQLAASEKSDVLATFSHPVKHQLRAVAFDLNGRAAWTTLDYNVKGDFEALGKALTGDFSVVSSDLADSKWVVLETRDVGARRYWLWDRKSRKAELLFSTQPRLDAFALQSMVPVSIPARDGLTLAGYLTRPDTSLKPGPLVLLVHGGPWSRTTWGFDGAAQLWANRGYAVLQVNFRGSTGYGKRFLNAGNRQWGLKMHDDLADAVAWAVKEGVADPRRVAISGASYGGYATLAALAFTPELFACGVDVVGPSNLFTLLATVPPYWAAQRGVFVKRMGDPDDAKDKDLLKAASPLFSAERIRAPLLIGQGANDPRVKPAEAEQLVAAMEKKGLPVTYVLYPDEGHGFVRPENRLDFLARAEAFLAKCLAGRAEPLPKEGKIPGSTGVVRVVARRP
jgi:dipeptidyl aminopeptidase/acylaminoacyl peptidase